MLRINLVPREVLDRHRFEGWYRYVFIISAGLILLVLLTTAGLYLLVQQRADDLQTAQDKTAQYVVQGKAFDVFQKKEQELTDRQTLVQDVLADRLNVGKIAEEISMMLPDEVWIDLLNIDQTSGLSFVANTPRTKSQSADIAYKSVARTLVRVNELPEITDVWLSNAANVTWNNWDPSVVSTQTPVVGFTVTAKVLPPSQVPSTTAGSR
jgi:Tfp pilus assembly protein PilN